MLTDEQLDAAFRKAISTPTSGNAKPTAYLTLDEEGAPCMLFFDVDEARNYCAIDEDPEPLFRGASPAPAPLPYAEECETCGSATQGLAGEPKWCCYCGAKLTGKAAFGPLGRSYPTKDLAVLAERAAAQIAIQWMQDNPGRIPSVDELRKAWALAWD